MLEIADASNETVVPFCGVGFTSCIWLVRASSRPVPNLAASCTSAVADHALLAETHGSASASLSFLASFASLAFATAFAFAFSSFARTAFKVRSEETSAKLPLLQKLTYLAVVGTNGNSGVFVDDAVRGDI